jgi:hypothetical protein
LVFVGHVPCRAVMRRDTGMGAMKTKVIVWRAINGGTAEEKLNDWLSKNSHIEIKNITQSESGNVTANHRITYTIWYIEPKG